MINGKINKMTEAHLKNSQEIQDVQSETVETPSPPYACASGPISALKTDVLESLFGVRGNGTVQMGGGTVSFGPMSHGERVVTPGGPGQHMGEETIQTGEVTVQTGGGTVQMGGGTVSFGPMSHGGWVVTPGGPGQPMTIRQVTDDEIRKA